MKSFLLTAALSLMMSAATLAAPTDGGNTTKRSPAEYRREVKACDNILEKNKRDGATYRRRADAEVQLKDYKEAIADYTKAIQLKAADADVFYNRGMAYMQAKDQDLKRALADFSAALRLRPDDAGTLYARGVARVMLFDYKNAIYDFNKALIFDEKLADAYEYRGIAYAGLEKHDEACRDLSKAVELNPNAAKSQRQYCKEGRSDVATK